MNMFTLKEMALEINSRLLVRLSIDITYYLLF